MANGNASVQGSGNLVFSSGDEGGDLVMNGGLPSQALSLLIGPPGAGKTVLALQIAFTAARAGRNVVYMTNISESHIRMLQHARNFSFFYEPAVRQNFNLISINANVQQQGVDATINYITDVARSAKADLLIIDSYLGLKQLFQSQGPHHRNLMFTLTSRLALMAVTTILLGEYQYDDIGSEPEFAVADAIVELSYQLHGLQRRRYLTVIKIRGTSFREGLHPITISEAGVTVFPRQETLAPGALAPSSGRRLPSGLPELDAMLGGGLFACSTSLVAGGLGTGKTLLGLHFLLAGAGDEVGLLVSFRESAGQIEAWAGEAGLSKGPHLASQLQILDFPAVDLDLDRVAWTMRKALKQHKVRRVVIDSLDELEQANHGQRPLAGFLVALIAMLREDQITTMLICERGPLANRRSDPGLRDVLFADVVLYMHYLELDAQLQRSLAVIKHRGSRHDHSLRRLDIQNGQLIIGEPFTNLANILTGSPTRQPPPAEGVAP